MAEQSPDWKSLFLEEQRKREEEQRKREAAESAQTEERRRREAAEHAQQRTEEITRKTTLPEFLDACHNHLYSGLTVQTDVTMSTQGDAANANNKLRPERILFWEDFSARQAAIWDDIMASDFVSERHFTSLHTLTESGEAVRQRMMSSELDLHIFQRFTVEDHIGSIVERLYNNPALRRKFRLQGSVKFENHANTLSPEAQLEDGIEQMTVSGNQRRRSPRIQAQPSLTQSNLESNTPVAIAPTRTARSSRPRADQFCVYNTGAIQRAENRTAAFIVEYKAPHKLSLGYIYEGLGEMELEDVIRCGDNDAPQARFRRLVAAVITQAFSYMVKIGLEYGCVCTGEAFIFLRVPDDPSTVYYFLSVPSGDVGESTGWSSVSDEANRLHLTAVGQMLAFTLQALKTPPRGQTWRANAVAQLNSWEIVYDDLLDTIPIQDAPSSAYRPPRNNGFLRMSPVRLRRRPAHTATHREPENQHGASDEEPDPDTPSRPPLSQRTSRTRTPTATNNSTGSSSGRTPRRETQRTQYCTQTCLRGLARGGSLDPLCPNVREHGESHHRIDQPTFLNLIQQQLSGDLDTDCKPVGGPGACGVLFRIRLKSHGYIVAAKCTPVDFVHRLKWEATIYERLRPIQGIHIPVHLGNLDLETPYFYEGITELVHMMFLSFGGKLVSQHLTTENRPTIAQQVDCSAQAIHNLGVLHKDLMPRNLLWNEETGRVMVVDFERAELVESRTVLGVVSPNRKRKSVDDGHTKRVEGRSSVFARERQRAAIELRALL